MQGEIDGLCAGVSTGVVTGVGGGGSWACVGGTGYGQADGRMGGGGCRAWRGGGDGRDLLCGGMESGEECGSVQGGKVTALHVSLVYFSAFLKLLRRRLVMWHIHIQTHIQNNLYKHTDKKKMFVYVTLARYNNTVVVVVIFVVYPFPWSSSDSKK